MSTSVCSLQELPCCNRMGASLVFQWVKNLPAVQDTQVRSLGKEDPLEKVMATHSSILAWKIPWMEELGELQSMGMTEWLKHSHDRVGGLAIQKLLSVVRIYKVLMLLVMIFEMVETAKVLDILKITLNRSRCSLELCSRGVCSPPKQPFSYLKFPLPNHWVLCYHF